MNMILKFNSDNVMDFLATNERNESNNPNSKNIHIFAREQKHRLVTDALSMAVHNLTQPRPESQTFMGRFSMIMHCL